MMEVAFQQSLFLETMVYEYSNFICRVLLQSVGNVINNGRVQTICSLSVEHR